ncbi:unannotated protein [freshwater metagenome]|uniref:Unannotated protein n=1 Tax=freshwater metagenome TaxID=449393 RepID=A0A6J6EEM4_9ZZZZ
MTDGAVQLTVTDASAATAEIVATADDVVRGRAVTVAYVPRPAVFVLAAIR